MVPQTVINKTPYRACRGLGQSQACGFCLLSFVYGTGTRWKTWTMPSGVGMWVSHWNNFFFIIPVSMTYTGAIIILR